jgi:hypothetical protein
MYIYRKKVKIYEQLVFVKGVIVYLLDRGSWKKAKRE